MPEELRLDVLPKATGNAFVVCSSIEFVAEAGWYLAGGTALTLQVGHRESVDLDFFTPEISLSEMNLENKLNAAGNWETTMTEKGTLYGMFNAAKISFIAYPFFHPTEPGVVCGNIRILSPDDIAVMKVIAVSQRGRKRDFIDLYWYLAVHGADLHELIRRVFKQYPQKHNLPHLIKSLTWFDDGEEDVTPRLFFDATWDGIKDYFRRTVPPVAKSLLRFE